MNAKFPYQKSFFKLLTQKGTDESTLVQYEKTLSDFFNYEQHFNETFARDQLLADFTENDIRSYLSMLATKRDYQITTVNKCLSNLRVYFGFLFEHRIITTLPTYAIKTKTIPAKNLATNWPELLPTWLTNKDLHPYTRVYLLLIAKGFKNNEIFAPGFYKDFYKLDFSPNEKIAVADLKQYNRPLQENYNSHELFLKTHARGVGYTLSLPALHRYLQTDSQRLGIPIRPVLLRKEYMLWYLAKHRNEAPEITMKRLRLDIDSLSYYQNQLRIKDLRLLKNKRN